MWRRLVPVTVVSVVLFSTTLPALASHTPPHAIEEVEAITAQALADMDDVVADFGQDIAGMSDAAEVAVAEDAAIDEIEAIWVAARSDIDDLVQMYPGPLGKPGGDAKKAIQDKRQEARNAIGDLADAWVPPATTSTTSTTSTTTTTTAPTTTTTGNGNSGNGGGGSGGGSGNSNSNGSGPPVTTQPQGQGNSSDPTPPTESPSPGSGSTATSTKDPGPTAPDENTASAGEVLVLATETPEEATFFTPESVELMEDVSQSTATQRMAAALDTVLPPEVVDLVLSPLLIVEILAGTILDGGARVIGPLALLGLFALGMFVYDRRSRRSTPIATGL